MNLIDWIILFIIGGLVYLALKGMFRKKTVSSCSNCSVCSRRNSCHK